MPALNKKYIPWIVVGVVLFLDQLTKVLVKTNMTLGQNIHVISDWFIIHFTENEGMAFGIELPGEYGKLLLSLFRILAVGFIIWYINKLLKNNATIGLVICVSLILAGAVGNIIDSAFYGLIFTESTWNEVATFTGLSGGYAGFLHGRVVDMLHFPIINGTFPSWMPYMGGEEFVFFRPVFNVADTAITVGVLVILVFQNKMFKQDSIAKSPDNNEKNTKSDVKLHND